MYTSFFGLSDVPFSIAPNPLFLYPSERHKEALTHLTHGLGETGGFVLLTGEVGTGKTTISRCMLDNLPENTQVAFILNPMLSCLELLATLCDELKIRYKKTDASLKYLTDKIQDKLLKNHHEGTNTVLIIDEAQHLQAEVLEQLRLLTNLETDTKKLLQVVLIGQPELQQLLKRRDLRQLAQRITARYHLLPLTKPEVSHYISHRLAVVDCHRAIFSNSAISALHQISQGIPRLINLLCDRALMLAYGNNDSVVNKKVIFEAAKQILGDDLPLTWWQKAPVKWISLTVLGGSVLAIGIWLGQSQPINLLTEVEYSAAVKSVTTDLTDTIQKDDITTTEKAHNNTNMPLENKQAVTTDIDDQIVIVSKPTVPKSTVEQPIIETPKMENSVFNKQVEETETTPILTLKNNDKSSTSDDNSSKPADEDLTFDLSEVEGVSDELLARLQTAIDESGTSASDVKPVKKSKVYGNIRPLYDMPLAFQNKIPNLTFDMHIYASDGQGWVRVNGRDRYEGDRINGDLKIEKILPQMVILSYQGEEFSLPALTNW